MSKKEKNKNWKLNFINLNIVLTAMTYLMLIRKLPLTWIEKVSRWFVESVRFSTKHIINRFSLWNPNIPSISRRIPQAKSTFNCVDDLWYPEFKNKYTILTNLVIKIGPYRSNSSEHIEVVISWNTAENPIRISILKSFTI